MENSRPGYCITLSWTATVRYPNAKPKPGSHPKPADQCLHRRHCVLPKAITLIVWFFLQGPQTHLISSWRWKWKAPEPVIIGQQQSGNPLHSTSYFSEWHLIGQAKKLGILQKYFWITITHIPQMFIICSFVLSLYTHTHRVSCIPDADSPLNTSVIIS